MERLHGHQLRVAASIIHVDCSNYLCILKAVHYNISGGSLLQFRLYVNTFRKVTLSMGHRGWTEILRGGGGVFRTLDIRGGLVFLEHI